MKATGGMGGTVISVPAPASAIETIGDSSHGSIPCLHCRDRESEMADHLRRSRDHFSGQKFLLAEDVVCRTRLEHCFACEALVQGDTCRHCGCLVAFRTRRAALACPHPDGPRWGVVLPSG